MEYQYTSIISRIENEATKYLDLCTILSKLQESGTFDKFYHMVYKIFE